MSALTLAMNEVQEVNSEEFLAVRAYHSLGAGFRNVLFDEKNSLSPASSVSSVIESCSSTESEKVSKDSGSGSGSGNGSGSDSASDCSSEKLEDKCKVKSADKSLAIMYEGRNILDLEKNIKPFTWQLSSFTQLSSPGVVFFRTPQEALQSYDPIPPSDTEICEDCGFITPISRPNPTSRT